jgi:hypothetical protein
MKVHLSFTLGVAVLCLGFVGCSKGEEALVDEPLKALPKAFEGKVDESLVGQWSTPDHKSSLTLNKDGTARMLATIGTRIGPQKIDSKMEWKVQSQTINFKDDKDAISHYDFKVTGKELKLVSPKSSTTYIREK